MKSILVIIPYENIYPPMSGGMLRSFHILWQLTKYFSVTAIIHQDEKSFAPALQQYPDLARCRIVSARNYPVPHDFFSLLPGRLKNALRYRWWRRSFIGSTDGHFLVYYPALYQLLMKEHFDFVMLENLSTINAVSLIRRLSPKTKIVYDAHNVDSTIASSPDYKRIFAAETSLYKNTDGVLACSEKDLDEFIRMNAGKINGMVIPNGILIDNGFVINEQAAHDINNNLIFCGSLDYEPNREGLYWFCIKILPVIVKALPEVKLVVIGKGKPGHKLQNALQHPSIEYHGMVPGVNEYYKKSAVAIVPLLSGSGTRLKILEAMSLGVPVIATSKGAEGIAFTNGINIIIADGEAAFAEAVVKLVKDRELALALAKEALILVKENYDWNVIGRRLNTFFKTSFPTAVTGKTNLILS